MQRRIRAEAGQVAQLTVVEELAGPAVVAGQHRGVTQMNAQSGAIRYQALINQIMGTVAAVSMAGLLAACSVGGNPQTAPAAPVAVTQPKPVAVEGSLVPSTQGKLAFQNTGRLRSIPVIAGQTVLAGDVLAQLDTTELETALRAAKDDLALSRAQEAQAREQSLPEQISAAAASVRASQTRLNETLAGPREADRRAAETAVEQASARLQEALSKLEQVKAQPRPADVEAARSTLEKAQRDADAAGARLALVERGAAAEEVTVSRAAVDKASADLAAARAALGQVNAGPTAADVASAQSSLDQARTKLSQLRDAPRATPQDIHNAELVVDQARAGLDKAIADQNDPNLVGTGKAMSRQAADAAVRQAQAQVSQAQNNLQKLLNSAPTDWEIRLAEESVAQAQASYDRTVRSATKEDVAKAQAQVSAAEAGLTSAQARLDQTLRGAEQADLVAAQGNLAAAQAGVAAAQARFDLTASGPTAEERRAAEASVAASTADVRAAQSRLDQLVAGPTAAEREQSQANVASAVASDAQTRRGPTAAALEVAAARTRRSETAVEQAQQALDRATLKAPFSGVVTSISVREGETVTAGSVAITVADLSLLKVETKDLDESATAKVREGQEVNVIVNALDRRPFTGRVTSIARQPTTNQSGDVFYTATIELAQIDPALRWGMTVRVEFK